VALLAQAEMWRTPQTYSALAEAAQQRIDASFQLIESKSTTLGTPRGRIAPENTIPKSSTAGAAYEQKVGHDQQHCDDHFSVLHSPDDGKGYVSQHEDCTSK
jgi:hypothetical protein